MKEAPDDSGIFAYIAGARVFLVGIKGTGMSSLAELLQLSGALVSGSDTDEVFYTDALLDEAGIPYISGFNSRNITPDIDLVVYSAAYDPTSHPELLRANELKLDIISYQDALGAFSRGRDSSGISGVHGKSTTTGMAGSLLANLDVPFTVLCGAAVSSFGGHAVLGRGDKYFVAETCEWRRHFLSFAPRRIIVTSIEFDHPDYFSDVEDVFAAFLSYARSLPEGGDLIYCADDEGACTLAERVREERRDIACIGYGTRADGEFEVHDVERKTGVINFRLGGRSESVSLYVPGAHNVLNATAAIALASLICEDHRGVWNTVDFLHCIEALETYRGNTRRSEVVGEVSDILIMDDYGHHPTAIRKTLAGLKEFYPNRRLVVDFAPHTYSRTAALFDDFARAFDDADYLILHPVYASAREAAGGVDGKDLYVAVSGKRSDVAYYEGHSEAVAFLQNTLKKGDLFLTLGAGDNWKIGRELMETL